MKNAVRIVALVSLVASGIAVAACSDSTTATDAGTAPSSTTTATATGTGTSTATATGTATGTGTTPTATGTGTTPPPPPAGNSYSLNGASVPAQQVVCNADLIAGSNSNRTSFSFIFLGAPTAGTYTVEAATAAGMRPSAAGMVTLRYGSDPAGGPKVDQMGQSGTVKVDLVGGKLHAVATGIPSKDLVSAAAGTIAGDLTCP